MVGKSHVPTRVAILDDYQSVALSMADWSALGAGVLAGGAYLRGVAVVTKRQLRGED